MDRIRERRPSISVLDVPKEDSSALKNIRCKFVISEEFSG